MRSRLNVIYWDMKTRCYDCNIKHYKNKVVRGVMVSNEWLDP